MVNVNEDNFHQTLLISVLVLGNREYLFYPNFTNRAYNFRKADFLSLYDVILKTVWACLYVYKDINLTINVDEKLFNLLDLFVQRYTNYIQMVCS